MRRGDFSELRRAHLRPDDRRALSGQRHSDRPRSIAVARDIIDQLYPPRQYDRDDARRMDRRSTTTSTNPEQRRRDHQFDVRVDHAFSAANRAFVRYSLQDAWREIPPRCPRGDGGATGAGTYDVDAQSIAVNDTHVFGPRWLNELRVGWSAIDLGFVRLGFGQNIAEQVGIPGINLDEQTSGMVTIGSPPRTSVRVGSGGGPGTANTSAFQVTDSLTHVRGRHTLKAAAA